MKVFNLVFACLLGAFANSAFAGNVGETSGYQASIKGLRITEVDLDLRYIQTWGSGACMNDEKSIDYRFYSQNQSLVNAVYAALLSAKSQVAFVDINYTVIPIADGTSYRRIDLIAQH